jgi:large subunit ribosomal protein L29
MKASDLRQKAVDDLVELQKSLARDVFQNRLKNFTNRLDDTSVIRKTRRELARVLTLLRERDASSSATASSAVEAPKPVEANERLGRPGGKVAQPGSKDAAPTEQARSRQAGVKKIEVKSP